MFRGTRGIFANCVAVVAKRSRKLSLSPFSQAKAFADRQRSLLQPRRVLRQLGGVRLVTDLCLCLAHPRQKQGRLPLWPLDEVGRAIVLDSSMSSPCSDISATSSSLFSAPAHRVRRSTPPLPGAVRFRGRPATPLDARPPPRARLACKRPWPQPRTPRA